MASPPPLVSVIIPAYNSAAYIAACVGSVIAQTFTDWECILVNDGSRDTPLLEAALLPFRERMRYIHQDNTGVSGARNTGIRAAQGKYLAFLDSDNVLLPNYLAVLTGILEARPEAVLVYPNAIAIGEHVKAGRKVMDDNPSRGDVTFPKLVRHECMVNSNLLARKEAVLQAGMFDTAFHRAEDFDLWLRLCKLGGQLLYTEEVLHYNRLRQDGLSASQNGMLRDFLRVLDKAERTLPLTAEDRTAIQETRAARQASLQLLEGKQALLAGRTTEAVQLIATANQFLQQRKLRVVLGILRLAPGFISGLYHWRERLILRPQARLRSLFADIGR